MKRFLCVFILFLIIMPFMVNADTYNESVEIAKNYLFRETYKATYQHYIFGNLKHNGDVQRVNGGLLSYDEFLITKKNKENQYSYLYDGYDYWTYTLKESKRLVVSDSEKSYIDEIGSPSTRVVVGAKANNLVMGNGTRNNPWIFVKVPRIKIKSNEYGKISTNNCTDMVSELDIAYIGNEIELCIKPNVGYTYISNTCEDIIKYTNGSLKIEDVNLDTSCEVNFGRTTYEIVLDQSNTATSSTPTKIYLLYSNGWYENKIGTKSLTKVTPPTRSGYKFDGYYTGENKTGEKVIDASGNIISGKTKVFNKSSILYPGWSSITYTINYYIGNMESGSVKLGSSTCEYDKSCTLTSFAALGGVFPYSAEDKEKNGKTNYAWSMYGWGNTQSTTTVLYTNSQTFTYKTVGNINLYAIGRKRFFFNTGVSPTSSFNTQSQYWNPYTTSNLTSISIPTPTNISSWTFVGYLGGSNTASASVTYDSSNVGKVVTPAYNTWGTMRSVYKRGLTIKYNANGGTGNFSDPYVLK